MARRVKLLFLGVLAFTISALIYTSHVRESSLSDQMAMHDSMYHKTKGALDKQQQQQVKVTDLDADGDIDEEDARLAQEMAERLRQAEQQAKDTANAKSPNRPDTPSAIIGIGSSANGQKKNKDGSVEAGGAAASAPAVAPAAPAAPAASAATPAEAVAQTSEEKAVEDELQNIVKKSPVIIFSKSYCPFSKRAKGLLLDKYVIEPAPFVVELDKHPLGPQLQARLAVLTGRKTVPNILVGGKSICGSDDIAELQANKLLVDKIKGLGGPKLEMRERLA